MEPVSTDINQKSGGWITGLVDVAGDRLVSRPGNQNEDDQDEETHDDAREPAQHATQMTHVQVKCAVVIGSEPRRRSCLRAYRRDTPCGSSRRCRSVARQS